MSEPTTTITPDAAIYRTTNGWMVDYPFREPNRLTLFEEGETENDSVTTFANLLRDLTDEAGPTGSRHSAARIHIVILPGDKHPAAEVAGCGSDIHLCEQLDALALEMRGAGSISGPELVEEAARRIRNLLVGCGTPKKAEVQP